jgi:hypothetical protein
MNTKQPTVKCFTNMSYYIDCVIEEINQIIKNLNLIMEIDESYLTIRRNIVDSINRKIRQLVFYSKRYESFERQGLSTDSILINLSDTVYETLLITLVFLSNKKYKERIENKEPILELIIDMNKDIKIVKDILFKRFAVHANDNFEAIMKTNKTINTKLPIAYYPKIVSSTLINNSPRWEHRLLPIANYRSFEARRRNSKTRAKKKSRYFKLETRTINRSKKYPRLNYPKGTKI